ncbi:MAG: hypothetical protein WDZ48_08480 [Pirellulales bacterium]
MVTFLEAQSRADLLGESVDASYRALAVIVAQYEAGLAGVDFNRYAVILQSLIQQQDQWALSQGQIGQGLIQVYRGLGGGWQMRLSGSAEILRHLPPIDEKPAFGPEEIPPADQLAPPDAPELVPPAGQPVAPPAQPPAPREELPMAVHFGPSSRRLPLATTTLAVAAPPPQKVPAEKHPKSARARRIRATLEAVGG